MICPGCGSDIVDDAKICSKCGTVIKKEEEYIPVVEKTSVKPFIIIGAVAVLVCIIVAAVILLKKPAPDNGLTAKESSYESVADQSEVEAEPEEVEETETEETELEEEAEPEEVEETEAEEEDVPEEEAEPEKKPMTVKVEQSAEPIYMSAVNSVYATSYLSEPQYGLVHDGWKLLDGDTSTAWAEDVSGNGIGESVTIAFDDEYIVSGLNIYNGHQKSSDLYNKNSRPRDITIRCSDGSSCELTLDDSMGKQVITFGSPIQISSITIEIDSVYSGSKYEDTCISEISLF